MPQIVLHEIDPGIVFERDGLKVTVFQVEHYPIEQPFGFRFETKKRSIVISGDTGPCENLIRHARGVEVLVHNCVDASRLKIINQTSNTSPEQLGWIAQAAKPGLLVTTHMVPETVPASIRDVVQRHYEGPLLIGEDLITY